MGTFFAVEGLSRVVLTTQGKGDKDAARQLLTKYYVMTQPLKLALKKLEMVPVNYLPCIYYYLVVYNFNYPLYLLLILF